MRLYFQLMFFSFVSPKSRDDYFSSFFLYINYIRLYPIIYDSAVSLGGKFDCILYCFLLGGSFLFIPTSTNIPARRPFKYAVREKAINEINNKTDNKNNSDHHPLEALLFCHAARTATIVSTPTH